VRSPHNIGMTIFARTGLIGLISWLVMLVASFSVIVRATMGYRRSSVRDEELFGVWLLVYLLAMLLISLLGVVLESPFGAAPFFWFLGVGLGWARSSPSTNPEPSTPARERSERPSLLEESRAWQ
jgi:O-antigen ligase